VVARADGTAVKYTAVVPTAIAAVNAKLRSAIAFQFGPWDEVAVNVVFVFFIAATCMGSIGIAAS
jgi:hypothetical protein